MAINYFYRICPNCNSGPEIPLVDGKPESLETGCNLCEGRGFRLWGFTTDELIVEE